MSAELYLESSASANSPKAGTALQDRNGGVNKQQMQEKQRAKDGYPVFFQSFPSTFASDPTNFLSPLRDNHSNYDAVSKTCLILNQFAANGSSKASPEGEDYSDEGSVKYVESSSLFHDSSFAQILSESFAGLLECIRDHHDRRCRILACKTVALAARAAYARLRNTPQALTGMRDENSNLNSGSNIGGNDTSNTVGNNYINRLDDEIGTDVPMALCVAALEDADDGVAATAMSGLGIMVLSTTSTPATLTDDELWTEIRGILQIGQQQFASSTRQLIDDDSAVQQSELQLRVFENTICPRLLQLISRFLGLHHPSHVSMVLPVLTASLVHLSKTNLPAMGTNLNSIDDGSKKVISTKRRQSDCNSLAEMVVNGILLPLMQESMVLTMGASLTAAFSAIRLIHVFPLATWAKEATHWSITALKEEFRNNPMCLEAQMPVLAMLMILSRTVPLPQRIDYVLEFILDQVLELPSTSMVPSGIVSAGLLLEMDVHQVGKPKIYASNQDGFSSQFRKPIRPAFWAEMALSFFIDGPPQSSTYIGTESSVRSNSLARFLKSSKIITLLEDRNDDAAATGMHGKIREEFVTAFCMVAFQVGRRHRTPPDMNRAVNRRDELEEWVRLSLALLNAFSPCVGWGSAPLYVDEEVTMLVACQAAYTRLLQEVLHVAGFLSNTSVSLKMTPFLTPPQLLWDQIEESSAQLLRFDPMPLMENSIEPICNLMDDIVKKEMRGAGIVSHHMRLFLMSFAVDQWIQARLTLSKKAESSEIGMNIESAKQLLVTISPRRMFGKVVESNRTKIESFSNQKKEKYKKYAQDTVNVCVACIESIALVACHYTGRFGANNDTKAILNYSVKSLQGKSGNDSDAPILPICQAAIQRIQSAFQNGDSLSTDLTIQSPLVPNEIKKRSFVAQPRIVQERDAFNEGYLTQLSRQIISTRAERCILSFPSLSNLTSKVRKQNWLRLSLPPSPNLQDPHILESSNVAVCTAGSDPAAVTLSYYMRRNMRFDGEDDYRLVVTMRVDNLTAVDIPNGLRLELGISEENVVTSADALDFISMEISKSIADENTSRGDTFGYSTVTYKQALKSGDHVTWNMMINPLTMTGSISLNPSIVFCALEKEIPCATWVNADSPKKDGEEISVTSGNSKAGIEVGDDKENIDKGQKQNVSIACEATKLSPMIGLQPCPFVFFRNGLGDVETFRFLWSRMSCQLTPFKLVANPSYNERSHTLQDAMRLASISSLQFEGVSVPGGVVTHLWSFMSQKGKRVMFVLGEQEGEDSKTLHVRGDDKQLLLCLVGTRSSREILISALKPGLMPLEMKSATN